MEFSWPGSTSDGEMGNWEHFLQQLYRLYKVVTDPLRNPFTDLSVSGAGSSAVYNNVETLDFNLSGQP